MSGYKIITNQTVFQSLKGNIVPSNKKTVVWKGHSYSVISKKVETYSNVQLVCRRLLAIFLATISLGASLVFTPLKQSVIHFWSVKQIYFYVNSDTLPDTPLKSLPQNNPLPSKS